MIAGGGFGGFYAARALERMLPGQGARVTLVKDANFMLYTPLPPGAAGASSIRATSSSGCARSRSEQRPAVEARLRCADVRILI